MRALAPVLVALLVGLLIGLDRERAEERKARPLFAGVRTFPLIALTGALAMALRDTVGAAIVPIAFAGVAAITLASYARTATPGDPGATTEVAALVTFLLGALAGTGQLMAAAAAGVAVAVLLAAKPPLERLSRALSSEELIAVLQLAVVSVIVLPLLPDQGYGPWQAVNPRDVWMVVVLVCGLSFAAFVATRLLGPGRGAIVTGALGGLVSSTAVTLAMAERSRGGAGGGSAGAAAVLASTIMCVRVGVLAGVTGPHVLPSLLPVLAAMSASGVVAAMLLARTRDGTRATPAVRNPFSLGAALGFAALYAGVVLLAHAAEATLGSRGLYATAVVSGLADADAPAIAFARADVAAPVAAAAIAMAAIANTIVKLALAAGLGAGAFRVRVAAALGAMAAVGAVATAGLAAAS